MYPIDAIRREFAALGDRIYLDICARSPLPASAVAAISEYLEICLTEGARKEEWLAQVEEVRALMANVLHVASDEIAFVKSTSEGINAFAHSLGLAPGDNVILCPEVEHPNNLYPWLHMRQWGVEVRLATAENGQMPSHEVERLADRRTRVVVAPHVSFKTGGRADLPALAEAAHAVGGLLFVDAAQSIGLLDIRPRAEGIDAMAACVHKGLLAPYGLGVLYCRRELAATLRPVYMGRAGVDLEDKREYVVGDLFDVRLVPTTQRFEFGSYNFPAIFGLGASLRLLAEWDVAAIEAHVLGLSRRLAVAAQRAGFDVLSSLEARSRSHLVCLQRRDAEVLARDLDNRHVRVSARLDILRAAPGPFTTETDVDRFVETLITVVGESRHTPEHPVHAPRAQVEVTRHRE